MYRRLKMIREKDIEQYNRKKKIYQLVRITVLLFYVIFIIWLQIFTGSQSDRHDTIRDNEVLAISILFLFVSVLIAIVIFPYFNPVFPPERKARVIRNMKLEDIPIPYEVNVPLKSLIVIGLGIMFFILFATFFPHNNSDTRRPFPFIIILLSLIILIFGNLKIKYDGKTISFRYGPLGKKLCLEEISEIEPFSIRPLKDYLGWGWRIGSDGSIGYISSGNIGIRIQTTNGRIYVVTMPYPQKLVNHIRSRLSGAENKNIMIKKKETEI